MQSLGHACIFLYSMPNAFNVFFASYMNKGNSLFIGNISPSILKNSKKLLSYRPYHAFKLYNLTNVDNFVNFYNWDIKVFGHLQDIFQTTLSHSYNHHVQVQPFLLYYPYHLIQSYLTFCFFNWWSTWSYLSMPIPCMVTLINSIEK